MRTWWIALIAISIFALAWYLERWWIVGGFLTVIILYVVLWLWVGGFQEDADHEYLRVKRRK
jgi:hypothetical protein